MVQDSYKFIKPLNNVMVYVKSGIKSLDFKEGDTIVATVDEKEPKYVKYEYNDGNYRNTIKILLTNLQKIETVNAPNPDAETEKTSNDTDKKLKIILISSAVVVVAGAITFFVLREKKKVEIT